MSTTPKTEDKIIIVQKDVCQLDEPISGKRAALLRELNDAQALTRVLPPEMLSAIFRFFYELVLQHNFGGYRGEKPRDYPVLTLGHVSSHWRQVAWSTPGLWNDLAVRLSESNARGVPPILDLHFRNARNLPFRLDLALPYDKLSPSVADAICSIETLLFDDENARKIKFLHFDAHIPLEWQHSISSNFSQLEYFFAGNGRFGHDHNLFLQDVPHLRSVLLVNWRANVSLPRLSITKLELHALPIDVCVQMLTLCPNLTVYHFFDPEDALRSEAVSNAGVSRTTLPHLQYFSWGYHESAWSFAIQHVQLPALHTLSWTQSGPTPGGVDPVVRALFSNLPDALRTLELCYITGGWTLPLIKRAFGHCRHVQTLELMECNRSTIYAVLCVLCPGWEGDETRYLPALRTLTIIGCRDDDWDEVESLRTVLLNQDFSYRILGIFRANFTGEPGSQFHLVFHELKIVWAPGVLKELGAIVQGGLRLTILDMNRSIEWRKKGEGV